MNFNNEYGKPELSKVKDFITCNESSEAGWEFLENPAGFGWDAKVGIQFVGPADNDHKIFIGLDKDGWAGEVYLFGDEGGMPDLQYSGKDAADVINKMEITMHKVPGYVSPSDEILAKLAV